MTLSETKFGKWCRSIRQRKRERFEMEPRTFHFYIDGYDEEGRDARRRIELRWNVNAKGHKSKVTIHTSSSFSNKAAKVDVYDNMIEHPRV